MPTVDREGLREALARAICVASGHDPGFDYDPRGIMAAPGQNVRWRGFLPHADALIAGPLSALLAQADTAAQAVADRDEARTAVERLSFTDETGATWRPVPGWAYMALHKRATAAQDEVARLSAEVEALREALKPFARFGEVSTPDSCETWSGVSHTFRVSTWFNHSDFRAARAALTRIDQPAGTDAPAAAQEGQTLIARAEGGEHGQ